MSNPLTLHSTTLLPCDRHIHRLLPHQTPIFISILLFYRLFQFPLSYPPVSLPPPPPTTHATSYTPDSHSQKNHSVISSALPDLQCVIARFICTSLDPAASRFCRIFSAEAHFGVEIKGALNSGWDLRQAFSYEIEMPGRGGVGLGDDVYDAARGQQWNGVLGRKRWRCGRGRRRRCRMHGWWWRGRPLGLGWG